MSGYFEPVERCKTASKLLGNQLIVASGNPTTQFGAWDSFDMFGRRNGVSFKLTKAAFEAVGLVEGCNYRFASIAYDSIVKGGFHLPGSATESNHIAAATTWSATIPRTRNFTFTIPFSQDLLSIGVFTINGKPCPGINDPVKVGIVSGFAITPEDIEHNPFTNITDVVEFPEGDNLAQSVQDAFDSNAINILMYFVDTPIRANPLSPDILVPCPIGSNNRFLPMNPLYQFGLLINNRGSCADLIFQSFNEGLRRIVLNGKYSEIIQPAVNSGQIAHPWTVANFPNLKTPTSQYDQELSIRLGVSPNHSLNNPQNRHILIDCNCKDVKSRIVKNNVDNVSYPCSRKKHSKHHKKIYDDSDDCDDC